MWKWGQKEVMEDYLPELPAISREIQHGRCIHDGYQRGAGIQFGLLRDKILGDPLYQRAFRASDGRSIVAEENRFNIYLIMRFYLSRISEGHIIEFGSYRGGNALFMAYVAKELYPKITVHALDTFEGMPVTDKAKDAHNEGDFEDVDLDELKIYAKKIGLTNLEFHKGTFQDTTKGILEEAKQISLAHIDCDIYSAVVYAYEAVKDYMVPGGYLVFDDATVSSCIGATDAVEELVIQRDGLRSEQIFPHYVFRSEGAK